MHPKTFSSGTQIEQEKNLFGAYIIGVGLSISNTKGV